MRFPFVSRERFDEMVGLKNQRIAQLEQEIAELRKERKLYVDRIVWGYSGVKLYDDTPQLATADEPEPKKEAGEEQVPTPVQRIVAQVGSKARAVQRKIQADSDSEYREKVEKFFETAKQEGIALAKAEVKP